jgi:hypothetical protein
MPVRSGGGATPDGAAETATSDDRTGFWNRAQNHPVMSALSVLGVILGFLLVLLDLPGKLRDLGSVWFAAPPTPSESENPLMTGLARVEIGMTRDAVAANIGQPLETANQACGDVLFCDAASWPELSMSLYDLGHVEVRALYDDSDLVFMAETIVDDTEFPPVAYLGWNLGTLGDMTYRQAVSALPDVEPTAFVAHSGPQSAGYGEMFEAGPVSQYRGLYLANAPTGYGTDLDLDSLSELAVDPGDADALDKFRSDSQPNTAGEFDAESTTLTDLIADNLVAITHFGADL